MRFSFPRIIFIVALLAIAAGLRADDSAPVKDAGTDRLAIEGTVYDEETGAPIPHVTIQVVGGGQATKSNADGRYRMILKRGEYRLKVSHVGYYSRIFEVDLRDGSTAHDVKLKMSILDMGERRVYSRAYDPAQRIILEAIRRKKDILSQINDYSFDAYSRLVVADADKPDSENVFMITESRSTSYWEQPDKYKEVITGRTQSANLPASGNLVGVGEMLNFNRNRIDLGRYQVVSPTARDAMDYYNYYLLDTVYIDGRPVFVLEVEPKNKYLPLFVGEIQIADSTFDVVKVDVGFSDGLYLPMIDSARYYQSMAQFEDRYWLPVEIGFSGLVSFDVPIPGIPRRLTFAHVASIFEYRIDIGLPPGTFGEYDMEVDEGADDFDSLTWPAQRMIPLTAMEVHGYERIDSTKHAPKPIYEYALMGLAATLLVVTVGDHDLFHFNRVEGPYIGAGLRPDRWIPQTRLRLKTGYAFDARLWQYEYGINYRLSRKQKWWVAIFLKDEIVHRPTVISRPTYNSTAYALFFKIDPFDYYREKGYGVTASIKPINYTRFALEYNDFRHLSQSLNTTYGVFRSSIRPGENPLIAEGTMRSLTAVFSYDSRKLIDNKGRDLRSNASQYIRVEVGLEYADPGLIDNDFEFRRYYLRARGRLRPLGLGSTTVRAFVGGSEGTLPPQKYFIVDFHDPNFFKSTGFNTVKEINFGGDRAASVYGVHNFGSHMFRSSGVEILQKIPFGFSIHGGAFWTEFDREPIMIDASLCTAPTAYSEIGFGLFNLTPFLMPFNIALHFTWQLSPYKTERFSWLFDFQL